MEIKNPSEILSSLKLEEFSLNKFLYVEELDNADGSFIISSIIKDEIQQDRGVILILCHNSIGHFHSIGQKLGYNLIALKESQQLFCLDVMNGIVNEDFALDCNLLKNVYFIIKKQIQYFDEINKGTCIIVESVGNFLLAELSDTLNFIQYLRGISLERSNSKLMCSFHNFPSCWNFNIFNRQLKHIADVVVTIKDLHTGRANDVTGHLTVMIKNSKFIKYSTVYHYLLQDKGIYVFAPGAKEFSGDS